MTARHCGRVNEVGERVVTRTARAPPLPRHARNLGCEPPWRSWPLAGAGLCEDSGLVDPFGVADFSAGAAGPQPVRATAAIAAIEAASSAR